MIPSDAPTRVEEGQRHVLVIEDDGAISLAMQIALEEEGYRVTPQHSGTAGLAAAVALHPDVIVLDVMLPDTDGWTMLRELKSWPETGQIPVIFVSAAAGQLTPRERSLAQGVVPKPFTLEALIGAVDRVSGRTPGPQ
jgi:CheY-like chemotaxis protein